MSARGKPKIALSLNPHSSNNNSIYGYFVEEVRQESEETFGTWQTQTGGMNIYTTIDAAAQREAIRAVRRGLHSYEDRHGKRWRGKLLNVLDTKMAYDLSHYSHADWVGDYLPGDYVYGLVMSVGGTKRGDSLRRLQSDPDGSKYQVGGRRSRKAFKARRPRGIQSCQSR